MPTTGIANLNPASRTGMNDTKKSQLDFSAYAA